MQFEPLFLQGAWRITAAPSVDARGSFVRLFDKALFAKQGLETDFFQQVVSSNTQRGTVRGLHFQAPPHGEVKLLRCTRGSIYDVMVDMRPDSPTYLQHFAATLHADAPVMLYLPAGVAHGFMTLQDDSEIEYHITQPYIETLQQGVRWNDPKFGIEWPGEMQVISSRDASFPDWLL
ncbi:MAG: dTDP-4-dehydrorhamnose 3,5-epimerase family protein [Alphaproteobacteria bacterium]|nr:dTDP-4-dehydrorhamnose 3,5-epimerase family protein [Alphaproteobacteria bacterium]